MEPQFKKYKETETPIRKTEFMTYPILDAEGVTSLSLQIISRKKRNSKFSAGFTNMDDVFLQIIAA